MSTETSTVPSAETGSDRNPDPTTEILARLDAMGTQLTAMAAELEAQQRQREMVAELIETLTPVTRGAMDLATDQLSELTEDVDLSDVGRLARTAIGAAPQLEAALAQVGAVSELAQTASHLAGPAMAKLTDVLATAEEKGYFVFAREGAAIADKVVTNFSEDDVRALGDNVVTILNAVKELTQPEVMALLNRTALTIQEVEEAQIEPPGMLALARSMRDPQTRRGLARMLQMLNSVGEQRPPVTGAPQPGPRT